MTLISRENRGGLPSPRRSLLDLAPLELDCMTTLWPMGEGTVREIRDQLAPRLPRAYTTIMTIMDRLARKGVVERRKVGRAYRYRPNLSAAEAREHALEQVVEGFFGGSREAVIEQLGLGIASNRAVMAAAAAGARPVIRDTARPVPAASAQPPITGIHLAPVPSRLKPVAVEDAPQELSLPEVPEGPITSAEPVVEPAREDEQLTEGSGAKESISAPMDPTLL